ncbi:hypothetical protein IVA96_15715 [Bradyrhizobium sp. 159]|uniref:hypothetical protein n=1 Tax=unclassified Bradyrhizobium TaxID=2631580 RepID=UPI001FF7E2FA|nr:MULTISPECIES: hypothetical protein [unclassified Bradyrhizobium]MCK1424606.1 hypothetical protein [Bradyrhizobium sp. CW12]MCK1618066.1 hypothetical protein [Bradyrhizobium sp. 159]MCK1646469.1 hypothetical protein [Bradyrhizobium sp. 154]MCK1758764.1 hypothetical protein [Bradyrhizobium sp. 137]
MGDLLKFPTDRSRARRRGRRRKAAIAQVFVVPPARHRKVVAFVVGQMRKRSTLEGAEQELFDHLWLEASRLSDLGIGDDEIDRHTRDFARSAWRIVLQDRPAWGVA